MAPRIFCEGSLSLTGHTGRENGCSGSHNGVNDPTPTSAGDSDIDIYLSIFSRAALRSASTSNARYLRGVNHCGPLGDLVIDPGL